MKPKDIRKWFVLFTIVLNLVSSEYCSGDKTDTLKYERERECQNSIEKRFRESDKQSLSPKPFTHRYQIKNSRQLDFIREKVAHRPDSPNVVQTVRNGLRQSIQLIRRREIPNILNAISFFRSNKIRNFAVNGQRSFRTTDSVVYMLPIQKTRTRQISSKADTLTQDQSITRKIIHTRSDKLHLKENNIIQKENGLRHSSQNNKQSQKNPGERTTIFKANRIRIVNNENRQEQKHNIRRQNTGTVSRERLTLRIRSNNRYKNFAEKKDKRSTKNKSFISNPVNEIARILNLRSRVHERNFNRLEHNRFPRTEAINAIREKSAIRTKIRSTAEKGQGTAPLSVTSMSVRRNRITEVPNKNNNILRSFVRAVSLSARDDPQLTMHRNVDRTTRKELINGRYMNRNNRIMRENLRSYASRDTRFHHPDKIDMSTEQNVRKISSWLPSEIIEDRKSRYATYYHTNCLKVISTDNRNSKISAEDRKENRLIKKGTDKREFRLKTSNIRRLSEERVVVKVTRNRNNINNHRIGSNRRVEKNIGNEKDTILDYSVRRHINMRTSKKYLSRISDKIIAETRKGIEINIDESDPRRTTEKKNDLSKRRMVDRISENKYPDHSRQVKEINNADQRSFVFFKRRILMYERRDQRKHRQVPEPGKVREVRNFQRNTIFRTTERNTEQWSIQYKEEKKVTIRKSGMHQKLERDLRRYSFSDAAQIRKNINVLKLREEYSQSTRYYERHISGNRYERMNAVRNRALELRNNGRLSGEQISLRNIRSINPGKITRNNPSFIRSHERTLLNLNMQVRMRPTERNGRGFRSKLDILERYAVNRRMKSSKENEFFAQLIKNFENKLSGNTVKDTVLRAERNYRGSKNYKLEHLSSGGKGIQSSTDRASRRIRINVSNNGRNFDKRISGEKMREGRASTERNRRVFRDLLRNTERQDERQMVNVKIQERLITTQRSDVKRNVNKQNYSPMIPRNGRGFRGKHTNFIRMERILQYNYNLNNLLSTFFYSKQDICLQVQVLKPVENDIRFSVSRRASQRFSFDKNTRKIRNYERTFFENQRTIRNNQRALLKTTWKINSDPNMLLAQQTPNRNIHSIHRKFQERNILFESHYSSNRLANDRIFGLNQSAFRRYMRVERFMENTRILSQKTRDRRTFEESKLDNIRQGISNYRLPKDTILPVHGALGSPFISKDITFENRHISSPQIHSSPKDHLNAYENWNLRTVLSLTAHIILGLSIIMGASESDTFKCKSFKQRIFDALLLRTEVF